MISNNILDSEVQLIKLILNIHPHEATKNNRQEYTTFSTWRKTHNFSENRLNIMPQNLYISLNSK